MKHLGLHEFPQNMTAHDALVYSVALMDKLNIPFHKSLSGFEFGDLFTESNVVKFVNNEGDINPLLDLNNDDLIKSLLLSEMMFDDFFNYGTELQNSNSFHTKLELEQDVFQHDINFVTDATVYVDSTTSVNIIELKFDDNAMATSIGTTLTLYLSSGLPLFTKFNDSVDSTVIELMITFTSVDIVDDVVILVMSDSITIDTLLSTDSIEIITFKFIDVLTEDPTITLPPHYHTLSQISNLVEQTNVEDGYLKFSGTDIKFGFDWSLQLDKGRIVNSVFEKNQSRQLERETHFVVNSSNSTFEDSVGYTLTEIDLGGGVFINEYDSTSVDIILRDKIELITNRGWLAANNTVTSLSDFTNFQNSYLVEIVEFNYDYIFGIENTENVGSLINVKYEQVDKTSINTITSYEIDIDLNKITAIAGYQDITIIQPNINTIPTTASQYFPIMKDAKSDILLIKPTKFENNNSDTRLNLVDRSLLSVTLNDSTNTTIELMIEEFDYILNVQTTVMETFTTDTKIILDAGMYKIKTNTDMYTYNVIYY